MQLKKLLCLTLSTLLVCSFIGCKEEEKEENETPTVSTDNPSYSEITLTEELFYKNGVSEYKLVVPADHYGVNETRAVQEMNTFLGESLGLQLPVVTDDSVRYDNEQKFISIGRTSLFEQSGIEADDDVLKSSGYMLKSMENTLYLVGSSYDYSNYGVIYAVYDFLEEMIGLKLYTKDCYIYDRPMTIKMRNFDVLELPDIDYRKITTVRMDDLYKMRTRTLSGPSNITRVMVHTHFAFLPKEKYYEANPDWYNSQGNQLRQLNKEMQAAYVEECKQFLRDYPAQQLIYFGLEDNETDLSPGDKQLAKELYNTDASGVNIVFCNSVIEAIEEWLPTEFPGRRVEYATLAYYSHYNAPVMYDSETEEYTPDSEWVIPHEKLAVHFAPINRANFGDPLTATSNDATLSVLKGWSALTDNIWMYNYGINYRNYFMNFNNFGSYGEDVKTLKEYGVSGWTDLMASNSNTPNFEELRLYVQSQLLWDTSLNYFEKAQEFISVFYGAAAEQVQEYFDLTVNQLLINKTENNMPQGISVGNPAAATYWPFELVNKMAKILDEGETEYEYLKAENPDLYKTMVYRIRAQKVTVQYLQMQNYQHYYSRDEILRILDEMEDSCLYHKFLRVDEREVSYSIITKIGEWRLGNL